MTTYVEHGITANQKLILECIEPGLWFDPQDYENLKKFTSRISACRQMADKKILLKRPYSDLGYITFEYMLPVAKADELGIVRRVIEND